MSLIPSPSHSTPSFMVYSSTYVHVPSNPPSTYLELLCATVLSILVKPCNNAAAFGLLLEQNGNFYLLGVQLLGIVIIIAWTAVMSYVFLKLIDLTMGLRVSEEHERLGADVVVHGLFDTDDYPSPSHNRSLAKRNVRKQFVYSRRRALSL